MRATVYNMTGQEVSSLELPASIFDASVNVGLMHQAVVRQLANARRGTHKAKGRSEVRYSTAKIYRQKGTGRARHGSRRAPIFVGGGIAHGPYVRDYTKKMPRKMRRAALRSALTAKAADGNVVLLDKISMDKPKTKEIVNMLGHLVGDSSALVVIPGRDEVVEKSARNIPDVKILHAHYLNVRDVLGYDKLILAVDVLDILTDFLAVTQEWSESEVEIEEVADQVEGEVVELQDEVESDRRKDEDSEE